MDIQQLRAWLRDRTARPGGNRADLVARMLKIAAEMALDQVL
jgi:hypothetical protein